MDPVAYLKSHSLEITNTITGRDSDIDLPLSDINRVSRETARLAHAAGLSVFVLGRRGGWRRLRAWTFLAFTRRRGLPIDVLFVNKDNGIHGRVTVHAWRQWSGSWRSLTHNAPVKRARLPWAVTADKGPSEFASRPIDAVYTWVNAKDPQWRAMYARYQKSSTLDGDRFQQVDELRYSIRSLELFAPWFRRIHIFSNCQPPSWFRETERIRWLFHEDVMPIEMLPTFNSHAIETYLHELPGLAEDFVYFNDDFFLARPVYPEDFFDIGGHSIARMEPAGLIPYFEQLTDEDSREEWQCAAVNGARLIQAEFGVYPARLHEHAPYAFKRAVFREMIKCFPDEALRTRMARFRSKDDVSFASFLYHHFACVSGRAHGVCEPVTMVRSSNYKSLALGLTVPQRFLCMNDGGGSAADASYLHFKACFLARCYPFASESESTVLS